MKPVASAICLGETMLKFAVSVIIIGDKGVSLSSSFIDIGQLP